MGNEMIKVLSGRKMQASLTVEAAMIFPLVLFCIFWILEKGIDLYLETLQQINYQEIWEQFDPAEKFRNLEFLKELF